MGFDCLKEPRSLFAVREAERRKRRSAPWNCWREPPSGPSPKKTGESQRFSLGFSLPEALLVYRGEFTLIFPSGLVKPFPTLIHVERAEVASMYRGGQKIPGLIAEQGSRTMDAGARRCWSRFGLYLFCF
jgi:hypothetical protein